MICSIIQQLNRICPRFPTYLARFQKSELNFPKYSAISPLALNDEGTGLDRYRNLPVAPQAPIPFFLPIARAVINKPGDDKAASCQTDREEDEFSPHGSLPCSSRGATTGNSQGRKPLGKVGSSEEPRSGGRGAAFSITFAAPRLSKRVDRGPGACAPGYFLTPLRGSNCERVIESACTSKPTPSPARSSPPSLRSRRAIRTCSPSPWLSWCGRPRR